MLADFGGFLISAELRIVEKAGRKLRMEVVERAGRKLWMDIVGKTGGKS